MKRSLIFMLLFLFLLAGVLAYAGGVSPASYEVDFKPGLNREFSFNYYLEGNDYEVYVSGDLAEYVKVKEKDFMFGRMHVSVEMNLPESVEVPGVHRIRIGTREIKKNSGGVSVSTDVGAIIKVRVPYPGKYAELGLDSANANTGEDVSYKLIVYSRGSESILVYPRMEITNKDGLIENFELDKRLIESTNKYTYEGIIKTTDYKPGDYNLTAIVEYDGKSSPAIVKHLFRLGELKVRIINYTKELPLDKVNRYSITIESLWNDPIKDVYVTGSVVEYPNKDFTTPTFRLSPWEISRTEGFLDTNDIKENLVHVNLTVFYADDYSESQIVELKLTKGINWLLIGGIIGGVIILGLIITLIVIILVLLKKKKNEKK